MSTKKSRRIAVGAIISALAVVFLYISCLLPTLQLTLVAVAGILSAAVLIECGVAASWLVFACVSVLSLILLPDKSSAVFYVLFFGHYPILKYLLEKIRKPVLCWLCKLCVGNICLLLIVLLLHAFFPEWAVEYPLWAVWIVCLAVFVLFDVALTRLLGYYQFRIRPKFKR